MALDYHLERKLRFNVTSEHRSLYAWSIGEVDEQGQQVGADQIPWPWTLYFTATEIVLADELKLEARAGKADDGSETEKVEATQRRCIRAKLRPGDPRDDHDWYRRISYRMFGTDRQVKDFTLEVLPLASDGDTEQCTAWGIVSYDTGDDFRPETLDDALGFYLMVKPSTFERYAQRITSGTADEVVLAVGQVSGFYSEWSPDIMTSEVKVLTSYEAEHAVPMPPEATGQVPRMHDVGEARLYIHAKRAHAARRSNDPHAGEEPSTEHSWARRSPEATGPC